MVEFEVVGRDLDFSREMAFLATCGVCGVCGIYSSSTNSCEEGSQTDITLHPKKQIYQITTYVEIEPVAQPRYDMEESDSESAPPPQPPKKLVFVGRYTVPRPPPAKRIPEVQPPPPPPKALAKAQGPNKQDEMNPLPVSLSNVILGKSRFDDIVLANFGHCVRDPGELSSR